MTAMHLAGSRTARGPLTARVMQGLGSGNGQYAHDQYLDRLQVEVSGRGMDHLNRVFIAAGCTVLYRGEVSDDDKRAPLSQLVVSPAGAALRAMEDAGTSAIWFEYDPDVVAPGHLVPEGTSRLRRFPMQEVSGVDAWAELLEGGVREERPRRWWRPWR